MYKSQFSNSLFKQFTLSVFLLMSFLFTWTGQAFAHVEKVYFLKGKAGDREMAIKILVYDELTTRYISYFFQDDKKDRKLKGELENGFWNFKLENYDGLDSVEQHVNLKIAEDKKGKWTGIWTDHIGEKHPVFLEPMTNDSFPSKFKNLDFFNELDPFEAYKLSKLDFRVTKTVKYTNDLQCDWVLNKESGISFFRLKLNNNVSKTDSINCILETINLSLIQKYFSFNPDRIADKIETELLYVSNELISFKLMAKSDFKNQKSFQNRQFFTLDLKTAKEIDLESIYWLSKDIQKPMPDNLEQIYKYRNEVFAPRIFKMLQKLYPEQMKTETCDINKVEAWALPVWALTDKGLRLGFLKSDSCDVFTWAMIPYKMVDQFIDKKYHIKAKK